MPHSRLPPSDLTYHAKRVIDESFSVATKRERRAYLQQQRGVSEGTIGKSIRAGRSAPTITPLERKGIAIAFSRVCCVTVPRWNCSTTRLTPLWSPVPPLRIGRNRVRCGPAVPSSADRCLSTYVSRHCKQRQDTLPLDCSLS